MLANYAIKLLFLLQILLNGFASMKFRIYIFLIAVILLFFAHAFSQEKAVLTNDDQEKLANAELMLLNAETKFKEAENIYSEISTSQSTLSAEKIEKLNKKAIEKHLESVTIAYSAISEKFDVYTIRVELFWIRNPDFVEKMPVTKALELDAKKEYRLAKEMFNEQKEISDNLLKLAKASDAKDTLSKAFEIMKIAFQRCENPISEVISIEPSVEQDTKTNTVVSIKDTVPVIQDSIPIIQDSVPVIQDAISEMQDSSPVVQQLTEDTQTAINITEPPKPDVGPDSMANTENYQVLPDTGILQEEVAQTPQTNKSFSEGDSFRVQIAASRVPLNESQLAKIYIGPEVPDERLINEWYKYTIGSFSDYKAAVALMQQCGVKDAFIVRR